MPRPETAQRHRQYRSRLDAVRRHVSSRLASRFEALPTRDIDASFEGFLEDHVDDIVAGKATAQTLSATLLEQLAEDAGVEYEPLLEDEDEAERSKAGTIREGMAAIPGLVKRAIGEGRSPSEAMAIGGTYVQRFIDAEILRSADDELLRQSAAADVFVGWEGIVSPDACDPCQENAGRHDLDAEMYRHPGCTCERVPVLA